MGHRQNKGKDHSRQPFGLNLGQFFENQARDRRQAKEEIVRFHRLGATHARIPVTWGENFATLPLDSEGFRQLMETVEFAVEKELIVLINMHHEKWLTEHYDGTKHFDDVVHRMAQEIAKKFKHIAGPNIIFECLNEPRDLLGDWGSGGVIPDDRKAQILTRQVNSAIYRGWRSIRTDNLVLVSPNGMANLHCYKSIYPVTKDLPKAEDVHLGASIHCYDDWKFCGEDGEDSVFKTDKSAEEFVQKTFQRFWSELSDCHKKTPLHMTEFGIGRRSGPKGTSRQLTFLKSMVTEMRVLGIIPYLWLDGGWFEHSNESIRVLFE
jgi:endoglucanase